MGVLWGILPAVGGILGAILRAWMLKAVEEADGPAPRCPGCGAILHDHLDPRVALAMLRLSPQQRRVVDPMLFRFGQWIDVAELEATSPRPLGLNGLNALLYGLRKRLSTVGLKVEASWGQRRLTWRDL